MLQSISNNQTSIQFPNLNKSLRSTNDNVQNAQSLFEDFEGVETSKENVNIKIGNINTDEVKQIAKSVGEQNLSDDDIRYGMYYGRSVIADYEV